MAKRQGPPLAAPKPLVEPSRAATPMAGLFIIGIAALGAAIVMFFFRAQVDESMLLVLLGVFAIAGVFYMFASVTGFVHFGSGKNADHPGIDYLNSLSDGVCILDSKQTVIYANAAYGTLTGISNPADAQAPEQVLSKLDGASNALYRLSNALGRGEGSEEEFRVTQPIVGEAGTPAWYRASARLMRIGDGGETMQVWSITDVTNEREEQERVFVELQQAIDHLDRAPVGFFAADGDGSVQYINATLAGWLGVDLVRFTPGSMAVAQLIGDEPAMILTDMRAEPGTSRNAVVDMDVVDQNGGQLALQFIHRTQALSDGRMAPTRTIVVNRNEAGQNTVASGGSDWRFNRFFNATPMAIASLDADGRILRTNLGFASQFKGIIDADAISRRVHFDTAFAEADRERFARAFEAARANKANIEPFDAVLPVPVKNDLTDDKSHVRVFVTPISQTAGLDSDADLQSGEAPETALVYVMDMTEQKGLENQMAQSQKMQAVGQLAGGIAHDFNNVLTAIIMASDLLLSNHRPSDPSFPDIMNIKQNANRAASLVRQLLAFSRRQTLRPEVLQVTDVLADLRMLLVRLIGNTVDLKIEHARDLWPVKVDLGQFEQVIVNLCVNGRDAMPNGGTLTIRTSNVDAAAMTDMNYRGLVRDDEYVLIDLIDTGTGIEPDVLKQIFEPFFTTKEVGKGTGLGLSMVYGIVKQTGGHIYADSVVGEGTTFRIFLPRHISTQEEVEAAKQASIAAPVEKKRDLSGNATVLLVEDEDAVRMGGVRALQSRGYTVLEAGSGVEAMELMEEHADEVDIIVSDVVMPEMDGPTLLREVRALNPDIKFVFVSGYAQDAFAKNLPEGEAFGFLPKPFSLKQLATTVKEMLDGDA